MSRRNSKELLGSRDIYTPKQKERILTILNGIGTGSSELIPDKLSEIEIKYAKQNHQEITRERESVNNIIDLLKKHPKIEKNSIHESTKKGTEDCFFKRDIHFNYINENIKIPNIGIQVKSSQAGINNFLSSLGNDDESIHNQLLKKSLIILNGNIQRPIRMILSEFNQQLQEIVKFILC